MLLAGKTRLLVSAALLGICIFAASWTVVRRLVEENPDHETVTTTIHKLVHGELLQGVRPPQRNDPAK
jgi:hypothetical protein